MRETNFRLYRSYAEAVKNGYIKRVYGIMGRVSGIEILLASPAQLSKSSNTILQEISLLMMKNLKLYQHSAILEMLLDSLQDILVLSLLAFTLLG